jgi:hypothetical protein
VHSCAEDCNHDKGADCDEGKGESNPAAAAPECVVPPVLIVPDQWRLGQCRVKCAHAKDSERSQRHAEGDAE